jgi:hypothetical protein
MLLFDKLLLGGVRFVLDKLMVSVDGELNDDTRLREELLAAQMRVELGELSQEEFEALEDEVLARIREIRARRGEGGVIDFGGADPEGGSPSLDATSISGVEADFTADDWYPDEVEGQGVAAAPIAETAEPAAKPQARKKRRAAPRSAAKKPAKKKPGTARRPRR